jgi:hypothetical protein
MSGLKENDMSNGEVLAAVNTKNWYRKGVDLWAEFGDEIPFG